jgi:RsiG-like
MAQAEAGSRTREVLDPDFVQGLTDLPIQDVRRRRSQALAEREFQSYLRRLIQVRLDLLVTEQSRRWSGSEARPLVDRITSTLAEGAQGRGRGETLKLAMSEEDMAEAGRRAGEAMGGAFTTPLEELDDSMLDRLMSGLRAAEERVSGERSEVLRVHDALQAELKHRYREDLSQVPIDL